MKKLLIFTFLLLILSCKNNDPANKWWKIELPLTETPVDLNQWGVTKYNSLKLREFPQEEAAVIRNLPLGAIVEVIKKDKLLKNFDNANDYWYFVDYKSESGWIFGLYLDIFNTFEESEKKSEEVLFGTKEIQ